MGAPLTIHVFRRVSDVKPVLSIYLHWAAETSECTRSCMDLVRKSLSGLTADSSLEDICKHVIDGADLSGIVCNKSWYDTRWNWEERYKNPDGMKPEDRALYEKERKVYEEFIAKGFREADDRSRGMVGITPGIQQSFENNSDDARCIAIEGVATEENPFFIRWEE